MQKRGDDISRSQSPVDKERKGAGFKHETNKITIVNRNNKIHKFELKTKDEVAVDILNELEKLLK